MSLLSMLQVGEGGTIYDPSVEGIVPAAVVCFHCMGGVQCGNESGASVGPELYGAREGGMPVHASRAAILAIRGTTIGSRP